MSYLIGISNLARKSSTISREIECNLLDQFLSVGLDLRILNRPRDIIRAD
jgi:hypothetical protein